MVFPVNFALLTEGDTAGKPLFLEMFKACIIVGKLAVKIINRVPQMLWNCLTAIHGINRVAQPYLMSRDNYQVLWGWGVWLRDSGRGTQKRLLKSPDLPKIGNLKS
jgi:hypothetical protein